MKIRSKLTLRYAGVTALVFSLTLAAVYIFSEHTREQEFFRNLSSEAVTKANLFLSERVDVKSMQSIYDNNREFIDEVEVAVYTTDFHLLYHDAQEIDIVKETPKLIETTLKDKHIAFYEGDYQGVAMLYTFNGTEYVITAAAYDGHGYAKLYRLAVLLLILWASGLAVLSVIGYLLARGALKPVSRIVGEVDAITESNLNSRLDTGKAKDELDELSETFNRMLDRLETSFNNQKMFISNVAHELRTPLAALTTELEIALLREQRTDEEYRTVIANVLNDAKSLTHLIKGLLDMAKANYDASQITTEELRLDELLLDARETVLKTNADYFVDLIFDQDAEDENMITVRGNEYLLKTAFTNLIENNCKFSDNRSSIVQISFFENNSIVRFSDVGTGIPADEVDRIFTPFYRGTNSARTKGQGIGMSLTQKIILLHNGKITVRSHVGEGTTFIIEIPHT